jgi:hypothetical protein
MVLVGLLGDLFYRCILFSCIYSLDIGFLSKILSRENFDIIFIQLNSPELSWNVQNDEFISKNPLKGSHPCI